MNNLIISPQALTKTRVSIAIIVLFHVVGLIGFIVPSLTVLFLAIVPWHLLLMTGVITYSHNWINKSFILFALLTFILGFSAEIIGVHTGYLFGNYYYGETLGIKLFNVPLMIGINWFLLVYSTAVLMQRSRIKSVYMRIITGALILVALDVIIEPTAIHFDYWHWAGNVIPIKNYICWFIISAGILFIFEKFKFKLQSMAAPVLLGTQFVFFLILGLLN